MNLPIIGQKTAAIKRAIRCGHCPRIIFPQGGEVNNGLYIKDGKPMCAVCRVLKIGKKRNEILSDKGRYKKDVVEKENMSKKKTLERNMDIGEASQNRAGEGARLKRKRKFF